MGIPHMGIFESPCPFPYGNHHIETVIPVWKTFPYGDNYLNPQMSKNSIQKRVSDWTVPVWKRGPVYTGIPIKKRVSIQYTSSYGKGIDGDTPFPYREFLWFPIWKCRTQFLGKKMGKMLFNAWLRGLPKLQSPFPYGESPYGNGQGDFNIPIWGIPISK